LFTIEVGDEGRTQLVEARRQGGLKNATTVLNLRLVDKALKTLFPADFLNQPREGFLVHG
jgi:hypothetical protein